MGNTGKLDIQRLTKELLASPLSEEELRQEMEARGVEPNRAGALLYAVWEKARGGDLKAAAFLRELAEAADMAEAAGKAALDLRALSDEELNAMLTAEDDGDAR